MLYHLYEMRKALTLPLRAPAEFMRLTFKNPLNPLSHTHLGRVMSASADVVLNLTQGFTKPAFGIKSTPIGKRNVAVEEKVIADRPFCRLLNFKRKTARNDPKVLLVAPISGHYATLLRGTVKELLPHHDVYITDWKNARDIPLSEGGFNLDDSIAYLHDFMSLLGPDTHVIAVCQPAYLVLSAISIMASERDPNQPMSMTLMGGPIDTRVSKTEVTDLAQSKPLRWFKDNLIQTIPSHHPGAGRHVYPGFLQLSGFMSMNPDTHVDSYIKFFQHLVSGDGESTDKHRAFYNEYLSVMDMTSEFYLQTISEIFQKQSLPRGKMKWRTPKNGKLIDVQPKDIRHTALMTIEGELDDVSARGQTTAAHELCTSLPQRKQYHHFQLGCGHYGIFNGTRWRSEIMPRIRNFIRTIDRDKDLIPESDLKKIPNTAPERFDRDKHGIAAVRRWLKENRPESYKICRCIQKRTKDKKAVKQGFYLSNIIAENVQDTAPTGLPLFEVKAPTAKPSPAKKKKESATSAAPKPKVTVNKAKKKKPRINKGPKPKVRVHLPLLEPLKKAPPKPDPKANVIEVSFTDRKVKTKKPQDQKGLKKQSANSAKPKPTASKASTPAKAPAVKKTAQKKKATKPSVKSTSKAKISTAKKVKRAKTTAKKVPKTVKEKASPKPKKAKTNIKKKNKA